MAEVGVFKLILHVDQRGERRVKAALNNAANFLVEVDPREAEVVVVFNGPAVKFLEEGGAVEQHPKFDRLVDLGVRFLACRNSFEHVDVAEEALIAAVEVVPAAIVELVRLQGEGYAYVKP